MQRYAFFYMNMHVYGEMYSTVFSPPGNISMNPSSVSISKSP